MFCGGWSLCLRLVGVGALVALAGASARATPVVGTYKSDDMDGGVFLTGRWTEGLMNLVTGIGNGAHAGSWDGVNLYTQWEIAGPIVTGSTAYDLRAGGTGVIIYHRSFDTSSAFAYLQAGMPWTGAGDGAYTVDLDFYAQTLTMYYDGGVFQFASSTETFTGDFMGHPGHRLLGQASGAYVGTVLPGLPPAGFPSWVPAAAPGGNYGEVGLIEMRIVPEPATLGLVGLGLAASLLLRRRR